MIAVAVFVASSLLSYKLFRKSEFELAVHLANVTFANELPRNAEGDGTLSAGSTTIIQISHAGKLDKLLAKDGDLLKKEQPVAYIDSEANQTALKAAIASYTRLSKSKNDDQIEAAKQQLQQAKQRLVDSIVRAPIDGKFKLNSVAVGTALSADTAIGRIEDLSQLKIEVALSLPISNSFSRPVHFQLSSAEQQTPLELNGQIRANRNEKDKYDITIPANDLLLPLLGKSVHVKIALPAFRQVALIDKDDVINNTGTPRILVLNSSGFMRWYNVSKAPIINNQVVIEGVSPDYFHVVKPDSLEKLQSGVAQNARPTVIGSKTKM